MIKEKITSKEAIWIRKKFNKKLIFSSIILPFIAFIILIPIYFLIFFLYQFIFKKYPDNLLNIYVVIIVAFFAINLLYWLIKINKKIKNNEVYKIQALFTVVKKQIRSGPSSDISSLYNEDYYELYIKNNQIEKGIRLSKYDYSKIKENDNITLIYFDTVDILLNVYYKGEELKDVKFLSTRRWKLPNL